MPNPPSPPQASPNPLPATPPPDPQVQQILHILEVAAGLYVTAKAVAAVMHVTPALARGVLALTGMTEPRQPQSTQVGFGPVTDINQAPSRRLRPTGPGTAPGSVPSGRSHEIGPAAWLRSGNARYRAAYIKTAIQRVKAAVDDGTPLKTALTTERGYYQLHHTAAKRRRQAVKDVQDAARRHGLVLGWYAHDDDKTTPDCRAADGKNFRVEQPPLIGYPGAVHMHCRCRAGRPHAKAQWVDEAVRGVRDEAVAATNPPMWTTGSYVTARPIETRWC